MTEKMALDLSRLSDALRTAAMHLGAKAAEAALLADAERSMAGAVEIVDQLAREAANITHALTTAREAVAEAERRTATARDGAAAEEAKHAEVKTTCATEKVVLERELSGLRAAITSARRTLADVNAEHAEFLKRVGAR